MLFVASRSRICTSLAVALLLLCCVKGLPHRKKQARRNPSLYRRKAEKTGRSENADVSMFPDLTIAKSLPLRRRIRDEKTDPFKEIIFKNDNYSDFELITAFSYETLWRNGTRILTITRAPQKIRNGEINETETSVILEAPHAFAKVKILKDNIDNLERRIGPQKSRFRRLIFPPDERLKVNTSLAAQTFPFSASVKISTGCSGSLISRQHVLTSAHCVYDGNRYIQRTSALQVGFLRRSGTFRWVGVRFIRIPQAWTRNQSVRSDYAVLKLHKPHKRDFFTLEAIGKTKHHRKIPVHFASFPGDKKANSLWYAHCQARALRYTIISRCDAARGSSGAGVYVTHRINIGHGSSRRVIIGVLSGSGTATLPDGRVRKFNMATKITDHTARLICNWIGSVRNCVSWKRKGIKKTSRSGK